MIGLHTITRFQVFQSNTNNLHTVKCYQIFLSTTLAQSVGAAEYTDCISAERVRLPLRVSWLWLVGCLGFMAYQPL